MAAYSDPMTEETLRKYLQMKLDAQTASNFGGLQNAAIDGTSIGTSTTFGTNTIGGNGWYQYDPNQFKIYNPSIGYAGLAQMVTTTAPTKKKKKLSEEFREEASRNPQAVLNQINGLLSAIKALHYA